MRILELDHAGGTIGRAIALSRSKDAPRTGLHLSTILDAWMRYLDPKLYAQEFTEQQKYGYQEVGNIVEDVCADWLRRRMADWKKPEPRVHRGITGSPDGWSPRSRAIHEIKACWKSERQFTNAIAQLTPPFDLADLIRHSLKLYGYIAQLLAYAEMWEARRAYLHVLFINGDYKPPAPKPRTFTITFTERERHDHFNHLRTFAKDIGLLKRAA